MAIAHYPSLHDGATLYLVQLTEGIHVNVHVIRIGSSRSSGFLGQQSQSPPSCRQSTLPSTIPLSPIPSPRYVNIYSPSILSLNSLNKILTSNFSRSDAFCQSTGNQLSPSDAPVASVKWIVDGCTLTFTRPRKLHA